MYTLYGARQIPKKQCRLFLSDSARFVYYYVPLQSFKNVLVYLPRNLDFQSGTEGVHRIHLQRELSDLLENYLKRKYHLNEI